MRVFAQLRASVTSDRGLTPVLLSAGVKPRSLAFLTSDPRHYQIAVLTALLTYGVLAKTSCPPVHSARSRRSTPVDGADRSVLSTIAT